MSEPLYHTIARAAAAPITYDQLIAAGFTRLDFTKRDPDGTAYYAALRNGTPVVIALADGDDDRPSRCTITSGEHVVRAARYTVEFTGFHSADGTLAPHKYGYEADAYLPGYRDASFATADEARAYIATALGADVDGVTAEFAVTEACSSPGESLRATARRDGETLAAAIGEACRNWDTQTGWTPWIRAIERYVIDHFEHAEQCGAFVIPSGGECSPLERVHRVLDRLKAHNDADRGAARALGLEKRTVTLRERADDLERLHDLIVFALGEGDCGPCRRAG